MQRRRALEFIPALHCWGGEEVISADTAAYEVSRHGSCARGEFTGGVCKARLSGANFAKEELWWSLARRVKTLQMARVNHSR
mmetsp:Transcript_49548/g.72723  ORF Transcript_49548/g.72723 Transcript_49548/m.72723 type:complete len:82 (+) Transcript_49548:403-648(+)